MASLLCEQRHPSDRYKELTAVDIQSGKSVVLWKNNWNSSIRQDIYPHLHSFAKNSFAKNQNISIDKDMEIYNENTSTYARATHVGKRNDNNTYYLCLLKHGV
jgi:hypothetical protein